MKNTYKTDLYLHIDHKHLFTQSSKYMILFDLKNQLQKRKQKNEIYDGKKKNGFILTWPTVSSSASSTAVGDLQSYLTMYLMAIQSSNIKR